MIDKNTTILSMKISDMILDLTDTIQEQDLDMDRSDLQGMTQAVAIRIINLVREAK